MKVILVTDDDTVISQYKVTTRSHAIELSEQDKSGELGLLDDIYVLGDARLLYEDSLEWRLETDARVTSNV